MFNLISLFVRLALSTGDAAMVPGSIPGGPTNTEKGKEMTKLPPLTPSAMRRAELIARIAESFVIKTKREQKPKMQAYHEIAEEQGISPTTVQNNLKRIGII